MNKFEVGEVAIYYRPGHNCHGHEVTILSGLNLSELKNAAGRLVRTAACYDIEMPGHCPPLGCVYAATPDQLRKRRPPQDWRTLCNLDEVPQALPMEVA